MSDSCHEALCAAACAAAYCADEEAWPLFESWLRDKGALLPGEEIRRDDLLRAVSTINTLLCEVQAELLIARRQI